MKISANSSQNITTSDKSKLKAQESKNIKENKAEANKSLQAQSDIKSNPLSQGIKNINSDIGRLQVAQNSLNSIESEAKEFLKLAKDLKETPDKSGQNEIKEEMDTLKKSIQNTLKKATFDGSSVFSKVIKDSGDKIVFDAPKLNAKLLDSDAQKFYDTLKTQQSEIKEAISTLQNDATTLSNKMNDKANGGKVANQDVQASDGSFLKKFSSLFKSSHDTSKLSQSRVQELLA